MDQSATSLASDVNASRVFGEHRSQVTRAEWEAAMREHGITDEDALNELWEAGRVAGLRAKLPQRIALCPEHAVEFYYPLNDGEGLTCPACSLAMTVYERKS